MDRDVQNARRMKLALLASLCLAACAADNVPRKTGGDPFPGACRPTACTTGPTITTAHELALVIEAATWEAQGRYTTGCATASANIAVHGSVTLAASDVALPSWCTTDCQHAVRFRIAKEVTGVTCLGVEPRFDETWCSGIAIDNATIRLRMVEQDVHPDGAGNLAPIVEVEAACEATCAEDHLACEATHMCLASARDYCAYCLDGTNEQCACYDGSELAADGTPCEYYASGDVIESGSCVAGCCVAH